MSEEFNPKQITLVKQKGVYSYEYMDSFERFSEDKLPDKKHFYKSLKNKHISEKDYLHAAKILNNFEVKNMSAYHDLCLNTDVLLLADVFEKFINRLLEFYKLDPSYYFNSPGLSWDAMLKMTEIKLELISDINKHYFVEKEFLRSLKDLVKQIANA